MRLIYTNASPNARKVRIAALECGTALELIFDHPTTEGSKVPEQNPLGKVPALILDDGTLIVDSPVICEFLDQNGRAPTLVPPAGPERIRVLTLQAIADGLNDALVSMVMETRRDVSERSPYWLDRWEQAIRRTLPELEKLLLADDSFNLGTIAAIAALDYAEFRFANRGFLADHPALTAWLQDQHNRPSVKETEPFDGPSR